MTPLALRLGALFILLTAALGHAPGGAFAKPGKAAPVSDELTSRLAAIAFSDIPGWTRDDHAAALAAFRRLCDLRDDAQPGAPATGALQATLLAELKRICDRAPAPGSSAATARAFFEDAFVPARIAAEGFVTGYYEPEVAGSRTRTAPHATPLYRAPEGLTLVTDRNRPAGWPDGVTHGVLRQGRLQVLPDRPAIMTGALAGQDLELIWLKSPVDAFFVHVQGSARVRLDDGSVLRVGYAGKTGHPYTAIGRVLVQAGEGTPEDFTMTGLRAWLARNPDRMDWLFAHNRSFIFFRILEDIDPSEGPIGAAGVPLVAGRSIAMDRTLHTYGMPVFVDADLAGSGLADPRWQRLMIADDTGTAIRGPARGDLFIGSGEAAGAIAGAVRHPADMVLLWPRRLAHLMGRGS
ncbi:transglycosylase [Microvirga tunisiensis]|uniref:peptidoglycan lytic exotransglycosylase n=1 Tax=Pannonibacter tanglangensis TaxID=2750084 RepID=A0A7X5F5I5_9HYPH|nr:MltA domain-containing protein [Pannonibacter sp. XCT-53]NBN80138.1 transglycosylase [Pannonibacter sp. XCT-53]